MHVTKGAKTPLEPGYVRTTKHPEEGNYKPSVYALDCEMVCMKYYLYASVLWMNDKYKQCYFYMCCYYCTYCKCMYFLKGKYYTRVVFSFYLVLHYCWSGVD